jgi:hypothetical protein
MCKKSSSKVLRSSTPWDAAGTHPKFDIMNTGNDSEMKKGAEERTLHRMAKVHDVLDMWQASPNIRTTQKESRASQ